MAAGLDAVRGQRGGPAAAYAPAVLRPTTALVCAAILVSGCSGGPGGPADPSSPPPTSGSPAAPAADDDEITESDFEAVAALLDVRAEALLGGDRRAFLATLDPGNRRLRRAQEQLFDNVQALPVDKLYYGFTDTGLVPADVRGDDPTMRPPVFEHLELTGVFAAPVANQVSMTFVERGDRWLVGHEDVDETFEAQVRPWFGVPIEAAGDDDLLVLTDRGADVGAEELLGSTREALAEAADVLDEDADRPLLVDATSNGLTFELSNASGEEAAAVSYSVGAADRKGEEPRARAGSVVKANPTDVEALVDNDTTLRHELAHFLLDGYGDTNPQWVTEGIAEYVGYAPGLLADSVASDDRLPRRIAGRDVELTPSGLWGNDPQLDYLTAHAFAEHLITTYGLDRYREMMDVFKRRARSSPVVFGEGIVDEVLRQVYGVGEREVARAGFALLEGLSD
ncbi:MAG: Plant Basic Secretory Protein [Nocardioides sp.]|nr:Plant Basic Secretory Protein [Nocardioides sp.]